MTIEVYSFCNKNCTSHREMEEFYKLIKSAGIGLGLVERFVDASMNGGCVCLTQSEKEKILKAAGPKAQAFDYTNFLVQRLKETINGKTLTRERSYELNNLLFLLGNKVAYDDLQKCFNNEKEAGDKMRLIRKTIYESVVPVFELSQNHEPSKSVAKSFIPKGYPVRFGRGDSDWGFISKHEIAHHPDKILISVGINQLAVNCQDLVNLNSDKIAVEAKRIGIIKLTN